MQLVGKVEDLHTNCSYNPWLVINLWLKGKSFLQTFQVFQKDSILQSIYIGNQDFLLSISFIGKKSY